MMITFDFELRDGQEVEREMGLDEKMKGIFSKSGGWDEKWQSEGKADLKGRRQDSSKRSHDFFQLRFEIYKFIY